MARRATAGGTRSVSCAVAAMYGPCRSCPRGLFWPVAQTDPRVVIDMLPSRWPGRLGVW